MITAKIKNIMLSKRIIPIVLLVLFCSGLLQSSEHDQIILDSLFVSTSLDDYLEYFEDKDGKLSIDEVASTEFRNKFKHLSERSPSFGYSRSVYWLKFKLKNVGSGMMNPMRAIKFDYPNIHYIDFFQIDSTGKIRDHSQTGTLRSAESRSYPDERFVFFAAVRPGDQYTIYFRVSSGAPLNINVSLYNISNYLSGRYSNTLFSGIFIGFILLACGYFSFLYFQVKDKSYIYLAFTGIFLLLYGITFSGLGYLHIWPDWPKLNQYLLIFFSDLLLIFFTAFSIDFLAVKRISKKWLNFYLIIMSVLLLNMVQGIFLDFYYLDQINNFFAIFTLGAVIPAAIKSYRTGNKPAKSYLTGLIILELTAIVFILTETGLFPSGSVTFTSFQVGALVIIIFWSKGMAEKIGIIRSEKEKAVDELQKSREQLALVIKGGNLGTWDWDIKQNKIIYNERWAEILGSTLADLQPGISTLQQLLHPDDKETVQKMYAELLSGNITVVEAEYRLRHKLGKWIWILDRGQVVETDRKGRPLRVTGTHLDITEMKNAEQQNLLNEQRYKLLFETAGDAIFIMQDDTFIDCNERTLQMFGCTKDQIIGKPPYRFSPKTQPDGSSSKDKALEKINAAIAGQGQRFEWQHSRYDGSLFDAEVALNLVELQESKFIQAIVRDITDRKRAEQLLEILNEAAVVMQKALTTDETLEQVAGKLDQYDLKFTYFAVNKEQNFFYPRYLSFPKTILKSAEKIAGIKIIDLAVYPDANEDVYEAVEKRNVRWISDPESFMEGMLPKPVNKLAAQIVQLLRIPKFILAPLISDDAVSGVITVQSNSLQETDIAAIRVFSHQFAAALKRASLYEQARNEISNRVKAEEALRESDARLKSIFEAAPVGIGILIESKLAWFNDKLCSITGYPENELVNADLQLLYSDEADFKQSWAELNARLLESGSSEIETSWQSKDGKTVHVILSAAPINPDNFELGLTLSVMDITDRITLENQFRQSQKMEAIGQLAGGVAHDFNNLLTVISGYTNLILIRDDIDEDIKEKLETVFKAAERAEGLTRQLLAFSRKQIARIEMLDINSVINDSFKILTRLIGEDITIQLKFAENLPQISADPHQIEQILINLMVNARDAIHLKETYHDTKLITVQTKYILLDNEFIQTHLGSNEGPAVMISISDNGAGMDKHTVSKVFEPFFTTKEKGKGTGLGLATVYGIIKQNKAYISVYSEPDRGTTFNIFWPAAVSAEDPDNVYEQADTWKTGSEVLLLVEDDESVRSFALESLQTLGYKVYSAENGQQALDMINENNFVPELVLTDVIMPGLNGHELVLKIKETYPAAKVIFASGYTDNHIINEGFLKKDVNFLQKPYSLVDLAAKVREVLDADGN